MELIITMLAFFCSAGVLYYLGKSGFKWGENIDEDKDNSQ